MKKKTGRFVFDAFPLLVFFERQIGWEIVEAILEIPVTTGERHLMSTINFGEVYYTLLRDFGRAAAETAYHRITEGSIELVSPSIDQTIQAAIFKAPGGLSYADCYAAALAVQENLPVLTGDREFEQVERNGVKIEWLPSNR